MINIVYPKHSFVYGNTSINVYHANLGEGLPKHEHTFSHSTMCCGGSIVVRNPRGEFNFDKNSQPVNLVANDWHEIEATSDNTVFVNIFSTDT